jgi:putative phosphoesterase
MEIGIISDTHGSLPTAVHEAFAGVDHILHAGDIGGQHILDELGLIAPVTAVYGNCDYFGDYLAVDETARIELEGIRFFIAHTPALIEEALRGRGDIPSGAPLPHICIHGHTHIPRREAKGPVLMLCPGSPVRPRGGSAPSVLLLEARDGRVIDLKFLEL